MNDFWILLTGALVAAACSLLGCFLILRKMVMIGDAISHAVLPGIVLAFLASGSRDSFGMLFGAAVVGLITVFLIQTLQQSGVQSDASIGVVFTALFALGILLVTLFARQVDLDLDCVLYGEIVLVPYNELQMFGYWVGPKAVWMLGVALALSVLVIGLFYKQFKLCAFDPALAAALGIPVMLFHYLLMSLVSITTVASFESVGAILVVGMLVIPPATAYLLTERLGVMIGLAVGIGIVSSSLGYGLSMWMDASIAGCMVVAAGVLFVLAFLFSPSHGIVFRKLRQRRAAAAMGSSSGLTTQA